MGDAAGAKCLTGYLTLTKEKRNNHVRYVKPRHVKEAFMAEYKNTVVIQVLRLVIAALWEGSDGVQLRTDRKGRKYAALVNPIPRAVGRSYRVTYTSLGIWPNKDGGFRVLGWATVTFVNKKGETLNRRVNLNVLVKWGQKKENTHYTAFRGMKCDGVILSKGKVVGGVNRRTFEGIADLLS